MVSAYFQAHATALTTRISMRPRNSYPKSFRSKVVQECLQPGATLSSVAMSHGINANVIRKRAAAVMSLIQTARMNGHDSYA
ncbi:hypothetical protein ELQ88_27065 [Pseudomonas sp. MPC6]|nr:hypothetical protein ELQ88_27065 [Pseudomonas sp. MPC6]